MLLGGCGVGGRVQQTSGGDSNTDASTALARVDEIEARFAMWEAKVNTQIGKVETRVTGSKSNQSQTGLINFAVSGGVLVAAIAATVIAIIAWRLWRSNRRKCYGIKHAKTAIAEALRDAIKLGPSAVALVAALDRVKKRIAGLEANHFGEVGR